MIKNLFTNEQKLDIKNKIHYLNNVLKKVQKEKIPSKLYEYYNEKDDDDYAQALVDSKNQKRQHGSLDHQSLNILAYQGHVGHQ